MNQDCPACDEHRWHTEQEWKNHPFAGHGFSPETGWSHPSLKAQWEQRVKEAKAKEANAAAAQPGE